MNPIQNKIQKYLFSKTMRNLQKETGLGMQMLYDLKNGADKKYRKNSLDRIYDFFGLKTDEFYSEHISLSQSQKNIIGNIFKNRRKELGFTIKDVVKKIKGSERQLMRIESGDSYYSENSYYLKELVKLYKFSEIEAKQLCFLGDVFSWSEKEMSYFRTKKKG